MRRMQTIRRTAAAIGLALAALAASPAHAQTGDGYDLTWNAMSAGGVTFATGGDISIGATVAQPGAGSMQGGDISLQLGFWFDPTVRTFVPLVTRDAIPTR